MTPEQQRLALAWPHYERLIRIARRRLPTRADAEDVAMEAIVACAAYDDLDPDRVAQLLTVTVTRRCIDVQRSNAAARRAAPRLSGPVATSSSEDEICDRAHARWVEGRLRPMLADNELAAALARADGASTDEIARQLGTTAKAAEMSLRRARIKLKRVVAAAGGVVAAVAVSLRRAPSATAPALAMIACVIAVNAGGAVPPGPVDDERGRDGAVAVATRPTVVRTVASTTSTPPIAAAHVPLRTQADVVATQRRVAEKRTTLRTPPVGRGRVSAAPWTVNVDEEESPQERVERCARNGVEIEVGAGGVGVVCRK